MRSELPRQLATTTTTTRGEDESILSLTNGQHPGTESRKASATCARRGDQVHNTSPVKAKCYRPLPPKEQGAESQSFQTRDFLFSPTAGRCSDRGSNRGSSGLGLQSSYHSGSPQTSPARDSFNSSFSFIQMSLDASVSLDGTFTDSPSKDLLGQQAPEPPSCTLKSLALDHSLGSSHRPEQTRLNSAIRDQSPSRTRTSDQSWTSSQATSQTSRSQAPPGVSLTTENLASVAGKRTEKVQDLDLGGDLWRRARVMPWSSRERMSPSTTSTDTRESPPDSDCCSLDAEATSSLSMDSSDAASASSLTSMTSGYESTTPSSDHTWDNLLKKYEGVLQECLQSTRTNTKVNTVCIIYYYNSVRSVLFTKIMYLHTQGIWQSLTL